jgi:serine/threonine-protein kinase
VVPEPTSPPDSEAQNPSSDSDARPIGRYLLYGQIAAGGMATVHLARQRGAVGFARTVAVKRLRPQFAEDPDFVAMFLDEARLAARIHHPNVVTTLDVVATGGEVFLVMEYVQGESLARLIRTTKERNQTVDPRFVATILASVLHGLHAAHEAVSEEGTPLNIVHRDVSPQNILVGVDGVARVLDFGVAKAAIRTQTTRDGQLKGKLSYMAPEQILGERLTRQADIYAVAVVLWEALTMRRLFQQDNEGAIMTSVLKGVTDPPSKFAGELAPAFDAVTLRGLLRTPEKRYATARDMALELERCVGIASPSEVGAWVLSLAGPALAERQQLVSAIERSSATRVAWPTGGELEGESTLTQGTPSRPRVSGEVLKRRISRPDVESGAAQISVTSTLGAARPRSRRLLTVVGLGGAAVVVALGALAIRHVGGGSPASPSPSSLDAPASAAPSAAASSSPLPSAASIPSAPPSVKGAEAPSASAPEQPPPQTPRVVTATPKVRVSSPKPASSVDCNPPYYFDDQGHKHYRDACFR